MTDTKVPYETEHGKMKRVVLKEELVILTEDPIAALVLGQFLYWSERVKDYDKFIAEEKNRDQSVSIQPTRGWIYKTSEDLAEELMNIASASTIRRRIKLLVENGWVFERNNPNYSWDRTLQYRANISAIQKDLYKKGLSLSGYSYSSDVSIMQIEESNTHTDGALPETTTETTTDTETNTRTHPKTEEIPQEKNSEPFTDADFKTPEPTPHRTAEDVRRGVEKATVKFFENAGKAPWLQWYSGKIYSRGEIEKEHLQHVGWLYEQITGTVPNSQEEWSRWRKIHETWYRESQFDFELLEDVLNEKCSGKYKTYNPTKITEAITAAVGENRKHEQEGGMRVVIPGQSSPGLKWQ